MKKNSIKSLGILFSRYCPAKCQHCGSDAGPHRKGKLAFPLINKILTSLKKYSLDDLGISGGEPLAFYSDMIQIAKIAQKNSITLTIFSNAFWAKNEKISREYLLPLKEYGLNYLILSTDQFHQEFINLENIIIASNVAESLDINVNIMIPSPPHGWSTIRTLAYLQSNTNANLTTHPIHPIGRAIQLDDSYFEWKELTLEGCNLVGYIEVDNTALVAQCPPASDFDKENPLILGDLNNSSVEDLLDKYQQKLLYWILGEYGPLGLYFLFLKSGVKVTTSIVGKISNCQLCQQLTNNQQYFKDFTTLQKIDLQSSSSMTLENQKRCSEIIEKLHK